MTRKDRPEGRPNQSHDNATAQPPLFDPAARASDPETSQAAARGSQRRRGLLAARILDLFVEAGSNGHTDDELQQVLLDSHPGTVSKSRHRLTGSGLIVDSGFRRPTHTGYQAIVSITSGGVDGHASDRYTPSLSPDAAAR